MEEVWVDCFGWNEFYEVSSLGRVRSKKRPVKTPLGSSSRGGKILKPVAHSNGYSCVNLTGGKTRKQELIHRLVLLSFVGPAPSGYQACHNNGIRSDCQLSNLRWDSISRNHADKHKHGTAQIGSKHGFSKLVESQAWEAKYGKRPLKELAAEFGVSVGCVNKIRYGQGWRHI
jgi:hypothetical protein